MTDERDLAPYVAGQAEQAAILATLGLDPRKPETQALMAAAREYQLDPLLGEIRLIPNRGQFSVYVTRDGCLAIAHRTPAFDGMETVEFRRNSTNDGYTAKVQVWRKDMGHPFSVAAQCKDTERQAKEGWGAEQALARSERRTLKRAFHLRGPVFAERPQVIDIGADLEAELDPELEPAAAEPELEPETFGVLSNDLARAAVAKWGADDRRAFLAQWQITDYNQPWPQGAISQVMGEP